MDNWSWVAGPLIGAVIGYCTNYIAVKMLFRPLYPVKIGRFILPFTPGIIPKGKERLAKTMGAAVGNTLLTKEDIEATLLSEEIEESVISSILSDVAHDTKTSLSQILETYVGADQMEHVNRQLEDGITEKIVSSLLKINIGNIVAQEGHHAVEEKLQGSFLRKLVSSDKIKTLAESLGEHINEYIEDNGFEKIKPLVTDELQNIEKKPLFPMLAEVGSTNQVELYPMLKNIYEDIVRKKVGPLIVKIDISGIIESKISQMDIKELEELALSVMKKELNAIVSLGALIGFILGLVNLFF